MLASLSLKVRLPLYVSTAMAVVLVALGLGAFGELRQAHVAGAHERLQRVSGQLASLTLLGLQARRTGTAALGRTPAIAHVLTDSTLERSAAMEAMLRAMEDLDAVGIELRNPAGQRILAVGDDALMLLNQTIDVRNGERVGPLIVVDDTGFHALAAPVDVEGEDVGTVYVWRQAASLDERGRKTLGDLIGSDARVLVGSLGGGWSDLSGISPPPALGLKPGTEPDPDRLLSYDSPGVGGVFAVAQRLDGTPWYLVVELPHEEVVAGAHAFALRLGLLGPIALLFVGLVAWGVGRSITRSLIDTTEAAEALAAGDHSCRVPVRRPDELGRLATSFNTMAQQIEDSQNALRDVNASLRTIFDGAPLPIVVLGRSGHVRMWNRASEQTFGWTAGSVIGKPSPLRDFGGDAIRLRTGPEGMTGQEYRMLREDGRTIDVFIARAPTYSPDGKVDGEILVCEDITARKEAELRLERYALRLSRSNEELENFAYVASHDLREPLRMVRSFTGLLAERYQGHLDADADRYISFAVDGATRMERLIKALLEYSRVDGDRAESVEVSTETIMTGVVQMLSQSVSDSDASVTFDDLPVVVADPDQLSRLFQNLVENALKFCRDRRPEIHVSASNQGDQYVFCVRDNGIGIEEEYFERIFQVFRRLHGVEEFSGTGIGLAICKKIVERHGGRIWLESTPGEGSRFYFSLPGAQAQVA